MKVAFSAVALRTQPELPRFEEPRFYVLGSEEALRRVYGAVSFQPAVDFSRTLLISVHRGMARSGGYGVEVEGVEAEGSLVRLSVRRIDPPPGAFVTAVITYPMAVIRVERQDLPGEGPWTFELSDEKRHVYATVHEQV